MPAVCFLFESFENHYGLAKANKTPTKKLNRTDSDARSDACFLNFFFCNFLKMRTFLLKDNNHVCIMKDTYSNFMHTGPTIVF